MHDMLGSAGMLRGWVILWTMQMLWLLATLTVSVGAVAVVEVLIGVRDRRASSQDRSLAYRESAEEGPCGSV
jgi:hypothetical protein